MFLQRKVARNKVRGKTDKKGATCNKGSWPGLQGYVVTWHDCPATRTTPLIKLSYLFSYIVMLLFLYTSTYSRSFSPLFSLVHPMSSSLSLSLTHTFHLLLSDTPYICVLFSLSASLLSLSASRGNHLSWAGCFICAAVHSTSLRPKFKLLHALLHLQPLPFYSCYIHIAFLQCPL